MRIFFCENLIWFWKMRTIFFHINWFLAPEFFLFVSYFLKFYEKINQLFIFQSIYPKIEDFDTIANEIVQPKKKIQNWFKYKRRLAVLENENKIPQYKVKSYKFFIKPQKFLFFIDQKGPFAKGLRGSQGILQNQPKPLFKGVSRTVLKLIKLIINDLRFLELRKLTWKKSKSFHGSPIDAGSLNWPENNNKMYFFGFFLFFIFFFKRPRESPPKPMISYSTRSKI